MYFVRCKCLWACPKLKLLPQRFENENAYINEMDLINGFDKRLRSGVVGFQFGSTNRVRSGSRVATCNVVLKQHLIAFFQELTNTQHILINLRNI